MSILWSFSELTVFRKKLFIILEYTVTLAPAFQAAMSWPSFNVELEDTAVHCDEGGCTFDLASACDVAFLYPPSVQPNSNGDIDSGKSNSLASYAIANSQHEDGKLNIGFIEWKEACLLGKHCGSGHTERGAVRGPPTLASGNISALSSIPEFSCMDSLVVTNTLDSCDTFPMPTNCLASSVSNVVSQLSYQCASIVNSRGRLHWQ